MKRTALLIIAIGIALCFPRQSFAYNDTPQSYQLFEQGYQSYEAGDYTDAITFFTEYLSINNDPTDNNYQVAAADLALAYSAVGNNYFTQSNRSGAIQQYLLSLQYNTQDFTVNYNLGAAFYNNKDFSDALTYFQDAQKLQGNATPLQQQQMIAMLSQARLKAQDLDNTTNSITNDPLSYQQYYLRKLNVPAARQQVEQGSSHKVVVAVLDEWVDFSQPDLQWQQRSSGDQNGRNFINNSDNLTPYGPHGTLVAGVIGASTNNTIGIAGIAKNVSLMSVIVCNSSGLCPLSSTISQGIEYAVDQGANIINLSLSSSTLYDPDLNTAINDAYQKGVIVVVAAGNGNTSGSVQAGVNTTLTKISPACNQGTSPKSLISVGAYAESGSLAARSNYGSCVGVYSYGEDIVSTTIPQDDSGRQYDLVDGTSLSTPEIAGIIALGYNKYGQVAPDAVYDALQASQIQNSAGNNVVDANAYLNNLGAYVGQQQQQAAAQQTAVNSMVNTDFAKMQAEYGPHDTQFQIAMYTVILSELSETIKTNPRPSLVAAAQGLYPLVVQKLHTLLGK